MRRAAGVLIGGVVLLAAAPSMARADNGFEAQWLAQTPEAGTIIESGERIPATMRIRNLGPNTWSSTLARLGPAGTSAAGRDTPSPLQADTWLAPTRIVAPDQPTVLPGEEATFSFEFRGPPASREYGISQIIAPLQDQTDGGMVGGWMDGSGTWPFGSVAYSFLVRPSVPPTVTVDAAPTTVTVGDSVPVTATAADNVRVKSVVARIDQGPTAELNGSPATGAVSTAGLPAGAHTLTVAAVDGAGNVTTATAPVTITASVGIANGTPAGPAKLTAGLSKRRKGKLLASFGRKVTLGGRLSTADGKTPIAGARVQVFTRRSGSSRYRLAVEAPTDKAGRYETRLPAGPSRRVRVTYRAMTLQPDATATKDLRLRIRSGVRLKVAQRGRVVRLTGSVRGKPFPRGGVLVSLQGRQAGDRWRPFRTVRAKGKGRTFTGRYRFKGSGRFRLRAVVSEQTGFPYARGISRSRAVRIR